MDVATFSWLGDDGNILQFFFSSYGDKSGRNLPFNEKEGNLLSNIQ